MNIEFPKYTPQLQSKEKFVDIKIRGKLTDFI